MMVTIIIGEEREYALRLRKYLEMHWQGPKRILVFTSLEALLHAEERGDFYLLNERFFTQLPEDGDRNSGMSEENVLVLSDQEKEGCHCRYHAPAELLTLLEERGRCFKKDVSPGKGNCRLTMVYSPVYDQDFLSVAMTFMRPGDLFLDMEDIGGMEGEGKNTLQEGNMGDLCYYIALKEKAILQRVREMTRQHEGVYIIDAPPAYLALLEIGREDYQWFFQQLQSSGEYGGICLGVGSGVFTHLYGSGSFDRLILMDTRKNKKQHAFCDCLEQAVQKEESLWQGQFKRVYREDIFLEES